MTLLDTFYTTNIVLKDELLLSFIYYVTQLTLLIPCFPWLTFRWVFPGNNITPSRYHTRNLRFIAPINLQPIIISRRQTCFADLFSHHIFPERVTCQQCPSIIAGAASRALEACFPAPHLPRDSLRKKTWQLIQPWLH